MHRPTCQTGELDRTHHRPTRLFGELNPSNSPNGRVGPNKMPNSPVRRVGWSKSSNSPVWRVGPNKTSNSPVRCGGSSKSSNSPVPRVGPNKSSNSPIWRVRSTSLPSSHPRRSLLQDRTELALVSSRSESPFELYDL